ncbi:GTPase-activator protein, putative [Trichomonas vaginalis G3]|uniref:GTPase-activator protein, putative n=1 Tax=Trichomonas vaginalis (strain ATCC PRA-98 / G3) TaxID=412133 RepID=A2E9Q3_TRIV3|nr:negative regulation of centriole-centriole cohesion [Trichomonas vaginalis G3]EAY10588.1 GTPase-activator protein, putative [Trichomonas vaginalis G3]KAI5540840.1 negative regulation of centriole-centriole cohesion [Trichomonas vaginalis G3]|eukprot:XP_001322811.1 GTPase-activator protein [Trichomonas vaginalis G3]
MPKFEKVVGHYIELLDASICRFCERENAMSRVAQIDSDEFLKTNFNDGCIVFANLSYTDLEEIIKQLVERIVKIGTSLDTNTSRIDETKFCCYCSFAKMCLLRVDHATASKALTEFVLKYLASLSIVIFSNLKTPNSHDIQKSFSLFFGVVGNHSTRIFDIVFENFQSEIRKTSDPLQIQNTLNPFIYLSSNIESLAHSLEHLIPAVQDSSSIPDNCRVVVSQVIVDMFSFAVMSASYEFYAAFQQKQKIAPVDKLLDTLQHWDKKSNNIPFMARCSTFLTVPVDIMSGKFNQDFELITTCFERADSVTSTIETYLSALNAGFLLVSETQKLQVFGEMTSKIFTTVLSYCERAMKKILEAKPRIQKIIFVNFGLALFFYDKETFIITFLNMLLQSIVPTKGALFCKFISRLCKHRTRIEIPNEIIKSTINCIELMTKQKQDCQYMRFLFKGFISNPDFMETIMRRDHTIMQSIITAAYNNNIYQLCIALLKFFEPERLDTLVRDNQMWQYILNITTSISSLFIISSLYQTSTFTDYIPDVTFKLAQFVFCAIPEQGVEGSEDFLKRTDVRSILNHFEIIALSLMTSASSDVTKMAISIINEMLNILHQAGNYESVTMPLEAYQTLVTNCKNRSSIQAMDPYFVKSLILVKNPSSGIQTAWNTIYSYFLAVLHVIAPELKRPDTTERKVNKPVSILHDELPNCFSILMALLLQAHSKVVDFAHTFLKEGEFVGQMAVDCLPTSLLPAFYPQITKLIQETIDKMQTTPGVFNVTPENNIYIKNAMKVLRNLLRQPFYYETPIDSSAITKLTMDFTGYCNLVSITDFHILCAHLIVAVMSHYSNSVDANARRTMTNSLGWWLSKPDFSLASKNATTVLLDALTKLLDGLDFSEPQYIEKFKFFVNIATTILKAQPKLKTEIQQMLTALFRNNINIGIIHGISDCMASSKLIRTTFILAVASVLKKPEPVQPPTDQSDHPQDLIDVLFETRFQLIETLMDLVPFSRAEAVGINLLEAAVSRDIHYELMDFMIKMELKSAHEASKNAIFRGNGVASRAVGHFPRLFGQTWMTNHLRPLFNNVIAEAERGVHYQINPAKLPEGQDIEQNRKNFRGVLRKAIDTILSALKSIPLAIVRVIQILYKRINEVFDGLGIHIVFGFVFLRFILPAFSVTALVGLPPMLPEEPRACLLTISVILMASATKGSLNEKGDHMIVFNDIAAEVHTSFEKAIQELIDTDLKDAQFEEVKVDTKKVIGVLEGDFSDIRRQLETKIAELPDGDPLKKSAEKLNSIVKTVKQNQNKEAPKATSQTPGNTPALEKFLKNDFKGEPLNDMNIWFYKSIKPPSESVVLYHLINSKLPRISDPNVIFYHVFKILKLCTQNFYILADFRVFDKSQWIKPSQVAKYLEMAQGVLSKLQGVIIVTPCDNFCNFLADCSAKYNFKKVIFAKTQQQLTELLGGMPSLEVDALETFTPVESIHTARYDNNQVYVRLHNKSIQVMKNFSNLPFECFSISVYLFDALRNLQPSQDGFTFQYVTSNISLQTTEGSNLYSLLVAAVSRANQKQSTEGAVAVEKSSVQWLLLNIAFASLISSEHDIALNYAAMQLVNSTYMSFDFSRTYDPAECPEHLIPPNCRSVVLSLSFDLAQSNLNATIGFLNEFFKMTAKLPSDSITDTIPFLGPWVNNLVKSKLDEKMLNKIIKFYFSITSMQNVFNTLIWSQFHQPENMSYLFGILREMDKDLNENYEQDKEKDKTKERSTEALHLINFIAQLNPPFASKYWVDNFDSGEFSRNALHSLLMADAFVTEQVPELLFKIIIMRGMFTQQQRLDISKLLNNLLAMLTLHSNKDASQMINDVVTLYSEPNEPEFEGWASKLVRMARIISQILSTLELNEIKSKIYKKFEEKLDKTLGSVSNYIGVVFCSALYNDGKADNLVKLILQVIPFGPDDNNHVLCYSFSLLDFNDNIKAYLTLAAITMLSTTSAHSALILLNHVATVESVELLLQIPNSKEIEAVTDLPLSERPFNSLAMVAAAYDETGVCEDMIINLCESDKSMAILAVQYKPELAQFVKEFDYSEEDWPTIAAISFTSFMRNPNKDEVFEVVKSYIEKNPEAFGCFNGYQLLERRNILRLIHDNLKILEFGKIASFPKQRNLVHKVVAQIYNEVKNKPIPYDQSKQILSNLTEKI